MSSIRIHFGPAKYKVPELEAAKHFYSKAFQVEPCFDEPTWKLFYVNRYELWLVPSDSTEEHPEANFSLPKGCELNYWAIKDIHAAYKRFLNLGASKVVPPRKNDPFPYAIVKDLWGNKIGIATYPMM